MSMNELIGRSAQTSVTGIGEETAEVANIQAKMILARNFPRNVDMCRERIRQECSSVELAELATYEFPRGNTLVRGPSIRLVEMVARNWGNLISGIKEISTHGNTATARAYAWDLETNFADEKVFTVELVRVSNSNGTYVLTDPRDRYEMLANQAARRKRACMQAVIPKNVIDEAVRLCQETLEGHISKNDLPARRAKMLAAFQDLAEWITEKDLADYCGKDFEHLSQKDIVRLSGVYNAIKEGFTKPETVFRKDAATEAGASQEDADALESVNEILGRTKGGEHA